MSHNKLPNSRDITHSYTTNTNGSKSTLTLLLLLSLALMISEGCAVKQSSAIDAKSTSDTQAKPTEIKITSTEFNYNPARIKVKEGQAVTFTLDNSQGAIEHNVVIKELGVNLAAKAGQVMSQNLVCKHPCDYEFKCTLPGHQESGMSGKLTVEPSDLKASPLSSANHNVHASAVKILDLPKGISCLHTPETVPPLIRRTSGFVKVELEAMPVTALLTEKVEYNYWTFNGTVPGPMIRLCQDDTVELTLKNSLLSPVTHSIDSHGITGPGGGAKFTQTAVGDKSILRFKAIKPGAYVYHCATPVVPHHISMACMG